MKLFTLISYECLCTRGCLVNIKFESKRDLKAWNTIGLGTFKSLHQQPPLCL